MHEVFGTINPNRCDVKAASSTARGRVGSPPVHDRTGLGLGPRTPDRGCVDFRGSRAVAFSFPRKITVLSYTKTVCFCVFFAVPASSKRSPLLAFADIKVAGSDLAGSGS